MRGIDPVITLLWRLLVFFVLVMIACDKFLANDQVVFTVLSGLVSSTGGALFMGIRSHLGLPETPPPGGSTKVTEQTSIEVKGNE